MKIIIIGAGPTGLGAAWRLHEIGGLDWTLLEANSYAGGLAASFQDDNGFTWDIGGHVQFSHYQYFDDVMDRLLAPEEWLHHERESYVRVSDTFVPYPFQLNFRHLPKDQVVACLVGLARAVAAGPGKVPGNFMDWILQTFGEGVADVFMRPYNRKVWAYPLDQLSAAWVGERVAPVNLERIIANVVQCQG